MRAVRVSIEKREDPRLDFITINSNALHLAAHSGHVDVVKELLKAGANPNITNWIGEDPKHGASNGNRNRDREGAAESRSQSKYSQA